MARQNSKGRKDVEFQVGDWVWLHFRKDRFPNLRKSKLLPRGGGPYEILEKINKNAYVLDLPSEFDGSHTFNVCDLSLCVGDVSDNLGPNCSQEGGLNEDMPSTSRRVTRSMARQGKLQVGALMKRIESEEDQAQVFHVFLIKELDL